MGRVDEAMWRAAEAGRQPRESLTGPEAQGRAPRVVTPEVYPSEQSERPHGRVFSGGSLRDQATQPQEDERLIGSICERIDARLQRKVVVDQGIDPASREQYRRLAAGLHAAQGASGIKVVMLASAIAGEGKSLTASNLALTLSESYHRNVLLIDADLRRPTLHGVFGLELGPGLADGLLASDERRILLHRVSSHLTVLTAGRTTPDPMAILTSERVHRLVQEAREVFDWVLIDTPPIGLLSDASLLSEIADGAVLVVRASGPPHDQVQRAVDALGRDRVLGVVLNRADAPNATGYQYGGYYKAHGAESAAK